MLYFISSMAAIRDSEILKWAFSWRAQRWWAQWGGRPRCDPLTLGITFLSNGVVFKELIIKAEPFRDQHSCQSPALTGNWWGSDPRTASWTFHHCCTETHLKWADMSGSANENQYTYDDTAQVPRFKHKFLTLHQNATRHFLLHIIWTVRHEREGEREKQTITESKLMLILPWQEQLTKHRHWGYIAQTTNRLTRLHVEGTGGAVIAVLRCKGVVVLHTAVFTRRL